MSWNSVVKMAAETIKYEKTRNMKAIVSTTIEKKVRIIFDSSEIMTNKL